MITFFPCLMSDDTALSTEAENKIEYQETTHENRDYTTENKQFIFS